MWPRNRGGVMPGPRGTQTRTGRGSTVPGTVPRAEGTAEARVLRPE